MKIFSKSLFDRLPDAILFDTDNTLYAYEPAHTAAHEAVKKKAMSKFAMSETDYEHGFSMARRAVKDHLGNTAASHNRLLYFQKMLEIMGLGSQVLLALDFEQTYWRTFLNNANLFEGLLEVLDELRIIGIPTAIVTDLTAQIQFRKILYFNLDHYFDYIVTSEEAGFDKPNAMSFKIALEKLRPKGDKIWMIGDNHVNDILGAKQNINAVTIQKIHSGVIQGSGETQPDAMFKNYSELKKLIVNLRQEVCA